jgi:hypothetical protein
MFEAGEGPLTPQGVDPHPPRSLALAATNHLPIIPPCKWRATSQSQIPRTEQGPFKEWQKRAAW